MRKAFVGVTAVVLLGVVGSACVALYRVHASLKAVQRQVSEAGSLPFTLTTIRGAGANGDLALNPGFETFTSSGRFVAGAALGGKLYLGGAGGLAVYARADAAPQLLRPGLEIPAAPVVAMATGRLRGHAAASVLVATRGEGLLIVDQDGLQQLRPANGPARDITAVLALASGDVLLGTRHAGLLLFDGKTLRLFQPGFANTEVTALAGNEADFWVGTRTHGVLHWHAGQTDAIDANSGLPDVQVEDIAISPDGVFVGTPLGVAQIVDGRVTRTLARGVFAHAIAVQGETVFVGTVDQGLREVSWKPHAWSRTAAGPMAGGAEAGDGGTVARFFRGNDALFAVTGSAVLRRDGGGAWTRLIGSAAATGGDENVSALSVAPDGQLWVGYFDHGIAVYPALGDGAAAERYENDQLFCINRIVYDERRRTMDIATANGLVLFDDGAGLRSGLHEALRQPKQVLTRRDGLISDQVTDVAFTNSGMVLATPAGLTFFTASGAQSLYAFQGLVNNHVYTLAAEPEDGRLLAGTLGGISVLEDGAVRQNVTLKNSGLKRNWVTAMVRVTQEAAAQDGGAATWLVGTYGGGVMQMDAAGRVVAMEGAPAGAVINPNAMLVTPRHVFAGSLDDGLLIFSKASRRWAQVTAGLPSRNVTAFAESHGELYIGTDNGIVRIAEARLP